MDDALLRSRLWDGFARLQVLLGQHAMQGAVIERPGLVASVVPAAPDSPTLNAAVALQPDEAVEHLGEIAGRWRDERIRRWGVWIDGQSRRVDDEWFLQRFTPRRRTSRWSKVNRQKVEALTAAGRMRMSGLAEVERAKADGRWDAAYDSMATASVPDDLRAALAAAGLTEAFEKLDRRNRYAILHRVQTAKRPDTRARRIAKYVEMLAAGETPH